jgi:hypothetical protein
MGRVVKGQVLAVEKGYMYLYSVQEEWGVAIFVQQSNGATGHAEQKKEH